MEITNDPISSVTDKLNTWAEGLDEDEREFVNALIARATTEEAEVGGFGFAMPVSRSMIGFGLGTPSFERVKLRTSVGNVFSPDHDPNGGWGLDIGASGGGDLRSL